MSASFDDGAIRWSRDPIVLLVDDEPGVLRAVRRSLRNEPYEVITAGGSDEALGWLSELPVDLIITDQRMPGMTGTELLEVVQRRFPKTAKVLLTAYRTPSPVDEGLKAGTDAFLYKPWDDRSLVGTVRRILAESRPRSLEERDTALPPRSTDLGI